MKQSTYLRKVLAALEDAGWKATAVDDGGDELMKCGNLIDVMAAARAVEDCYIHVQAAEDPDRSTKGWIRVVWQGPDEEEAADTAMEVICDYTMNLNKIIEAVEVLS